MPSSFSWEEGGSLWRATGVRRSCGGRGQLMLGNRDFVVTATLAGVSWGNLTFTLPCT